jgi:ABC-type phosphate/phosphonate transport system substrate-binding protein
MKMTKLHMRIAAIASAALASALLAACGGSSSAAAANPPPAVVAGLAMPTTVSVVTATHAN